MQSRPHSQKSNPTDPGVFSSTYYPDRYSGTDNTYFSTGCPAKMSDGRFLTNHMSANDQTEEMRIKSGIKNNTQHRLFLQQNGLQIMNSQYNNLFQQNTCDSGIACSRGYYDMKSKDI